MSLSKVITDEKGITASYHKIGVASQCFVGSEKCISVNVSGFVNADYKQADEVNNVVMNTAVTLSLPDPTVEDFSRTTLYERIKAECEIFSDAEDI